MSLDFLMEVASYSGVSLRGGAGDFPWLLSKENRRNVALKEIPTSGVAVLFPTYLLYLPVSLKS